MKTPDFTIPIRRALTPCSSDILGIFTRTRMFGSRYAGDRIRELRERLLRDGWLPAAAKLAKENGMVFKTAQRDISFLRRSLAIDYDSVKNIYVLNSNGGDGDGQK